MLTESSKIRDVWANPVGRDILKRVLLSARLGDGVICNPLVGGIKLKRLPRLSFRKLDKAFVATLLDMMNGDTGVSQPVAPDASPDWWKDAVFYQIYPRSFKDSDGDGVGDLCGILDKLDYLQALGVDALWLSPVYDSPNDDNGYDIRDYRKIMAEFGTMADFDALLGGRPRPGHASHHGPGGQPHLRRARMVSAGLWRNPASKYGDYYFFRDQPNNWTSLFGGSAWRFCRTKESIRPASVFKKADGPQLGQPGNVRREVQSLVRWWLQKGVDGFRMDVINFISKREGLAGRQRHDRRHERLYRPGALLLRAAAARLPAGAAEGGVYAAYGAFSVGETPAIGLEMSKLLTADDRGELDMVFNFDQLETPGHSRFDDYRYDLNYYKKYITGLDGELRAPLPDVPLFRKPRQPAHDLEG